MSPKPDFLAAQILSPTVLMAGGIPDPQDVVRVSRVYPHSPAEMAGIEEGDLLFETAERAGTEFSASPGSELLFYSQARKQRYRLTFASLDVGYKTEPTQQSVLSNFQESEARPESLLALWNAGQFSELQKLSLRALQHLNKASFLERLRKKVVPVDSPLTALYGAALFESGKIEVGLNWLEIYRSRYSQDHSEVFEGLVSYYFALEKQGLGLQEEANSYLKFCLLQSGLPRAEALWEEWNPGLSARSAKVGHPFPLPEELQADSSRSELSEAVSSLSPHEHLLLAVLAPETEQVDRARLQGWVENNSSLFPDFVSSVVTFASTPAESPLDNLRHFADPEGKLRSQVNSASRSEYFLLGQNGTIVGSSLHFASIWQLLGDASSSLAEPREAWTSPIPSKPPEQTVPAWPRNEVSRQQLERFLYLIPSLSPLSIEEVQNRAACPRDVSLPTLTSLSRQELGEQFGEARFESWVRAHTLPPSTKEVLQAPHFLLLEGSWPQTDSFAPLQSCLAACRVALQLGGIGVLDYHSKRWLSPELFQSFECDVFDIREHIGVFVGNGVCITQGLQAKFASPEFAMRLPSPHLAGAAIHLLYEIAHQAAQGKLYHEKSLFRWRSEAHLCQFMFRPGTAELVRNVIGVAPAPEEVLELVDLAVEHGAVQPSSNAQVGLTYFTLGAPHWNLAYGWPPQAPRAIPQAPTLGIQGLTPGLSSCTHAEQALGTSHRAVAGGVQRWLFQSPTGDSPSRVEARYDEQGRLLSVLGNTLTLGDRTLTDTSTLERLKRLLTEPTLERSFVAPPDQTLVRQEAVWVFSHPAQKEHTLLLTVQFGRQGKLWEATLSHLSESPNEVRDALAPDFGRPLMTGYAPSVPGRPKILPESARQLRNAMESSVHLIKQLLFQFGRLDWVNEDLDGYSITVGSYLLSGGTPKREDLEALGLPAQLFLSFYHALESFLEHPSNQMRLNPTAREKNLDQTTYRAFRWMLEALTKGEAPEEQLLLAVDLSQVFSQYKEQLLQLNPAVDS